MGDHTFSPNCYQLSKNKRRPPLIVMPPFSSSLSLPLPPLSLPSSLCKNRSVHYTHACKIFMNPKNPLFRQTFPLYFLSFCLSTKAYHIISASTVSTLQFHISFGLVYPIFIIFTFSLFYVSLFLFCQYFCFIIPPFVFPVFLANNCQ